MVIEALRQQTRWGSMKRAERHHFQPDLKQWGSCLWKTCFPIGLRRMRRSLWLAVVTVLPKSQGRAAGTVCVCAQVGSREGLGWQEHGVSKKLKLSGVSLFRGCWSSSRCADMHGKDGPLTDWFHSSNILPSSSKELPNPAFTWRCWTSSSLLALKISLLKEKWEQIRLCYIKHNYKAN